MLKNLNVVILAAGKGSRMRSPKPKALFEIGGKPLIFHALDRAFDIKPDNVYVVVGHQAEAVRAAVSSKYMVQFIEQKEQKGTGHALLQTLQYMPELGRLLVLYADVPFMSTESLQSLLDGSSQDIQWLSAEKADPTGYGRIVRDINNSPIGIVEEASAGRAQKRIKEVNTGIFVSPVSYLRHWLPRLKNDNPSGEYLLTDIMSMVRQSGLQLNVKKLPLERTLESEGINSLWQLNKLERYWQTQKAIKLSDDAGVYFANYDTTSIRGELKTGEGVAIDSGCIFEGVVELGNDVTIGPNCLLKNCQVAAGSKIEAFCHLDEARIGKECTIGPYARLRPGSILGDRVKVGNFVEVKNSNLNEGSKVNHLSYIGDADIGSEVNVGAGTITCNYDGKNKLQTTIKDKAFIGSNSALVAPVTIGAGAYVGAGSTITEDVPDGQLGIGRGRQVLVSKNKLA